MTLKPLTYIATASVLMLGSASIALAGDAGSLADQVNEAASDMMEKHTDDMHHDDGDHHETAAQDETDEETADEAATPMTFDEALEACQLEALGDDIQACIDEKTQ